MTPAEERRYLESQIAILERQMRELQRPMETNEMNAISTAMTRADAVSRCFGEVATKPLPGERALEYRRRLLGHYQKFSPKFGTARLGFVDASMIDAVEDQVYADAAAAARDPSSYAPFELRAVQETDPAGRTITRYYGDPMAWMQTFHSQGAVGFINRNPPKA